MILYYSNPNFILNLCADVVIKSRINLVAYFSTIKIMLDYFLVRILVHIYDLNDILLYFLSNLNNPSSKYFHLTTIFHHYLLMFLRHFFHTFFCLYQLYLNRVFLRSFRIFYFFLHLIIFS